MNGANEIGSVTAANFDGQRYALGRSGQWSGPAALVVEFLNDHFAPHQHATASSAVIPFGYEAVAAAAKHFGDPAPQLPAFGPSAPGVIN